jgi:hypothetical protein
MCFSSPSMPSPQRVAPPPPPIETNQTQQAPTLTGVNNGQNPNYKPVTFASLRTDLTVPPTGSVGNGLNIPTG